MAPHVPSPEYRIRMLQEQLEDVTLERNRLLRQIHLIAQLVEQLRDASDAVEPYNIPAESPF